MTARTPPSSSPSFVRYSMLAMLCALSMITYIDRAFWGNAREDIRIALDMKTVADLSLALVCFQIAYALFEVPTGYLGDRFGPRKTLIRIVLWWSFFFSLTALAGWRFGSFVLVTFPVLVLIRFCFGMGEAGAYPNITRALYNWFPASQRGFAQGAIWMSARLMGGLTPLIWLILVDQKLLGLRWQMGFWLFGIVGVMWCIVFALWFRNKPEEHSYTNKAEQDLIAVGRGNVEVGHSGVPWGKIVGSRNMWYICGMYVCINYGWYFFMYFLPDFLKRQFPVAGADLGGRIVMAILAGGPLLVGVVGCLVGGLLTDWHVRRTGDRKWGRRLYGVLGFGLAAGFYGIAILGVQAGNMWVFALGVALAGFSNDLAMGPSWAVCQDIGRRYAAIVSGFMNMIGNLGGALTLFVTDAIIQAQVKSHEATEAAKLGLTVEQASEAGLLAQAREAGLLDGYQINLILYALAYAIGVFFWLRIDATKPIDPEPAPTAPAGEPSG